LGGNAHLYRFAGEDRYGLPPYTEAAITKANVRKISPRIRLLLISVERVMQMIV
jgi:hypothetical protein